MAVAVLGLAAAACGDEAVAEPKQASAVQAEAASFLTKSPPPWSKPTDFARLARAADLPIFTKPIHVTVAYTAHLDIFDGQRRVTVPAGIGRGPHGERVPFYTRGDGVIQIAADLNDQFTLGELFTMWGVHISSRCVGGLCADSTHVLEFDIDGQSYQGNPANIPINAGQEYTIRYGSPNNLHAVPPHYPGEAGTGTSAVS